MSTYIIHHFKTLLKHIEIVIEVRGIKSRWLLIKIALYHFFEWKKTKLTFCLHFVSFFLVHVILTVVYF